MSASPRLASKTAAVSTLPEAVEARILSEFSGNSRALELCRRFSSTKGYVRQFSLDLIQTARGESGDPWNVRRLAALFLEFQFATAVADHPGESDFLLTALELKDAGANDVHEWLLREGFTGSSVIRFLPELLRKIQRRKDRPRSGRDLELRHWEDLLHRARHDSKLVLARYLFSPAEVVREIVSQVAVSGGVRDETVVGSADEQRFAGPHYETAIIRELARNAKIFWVNEATPSAINSLVEFPLGTVALVIKAPGSDLEIELKRAGMRRRPLDVLFEVGIMPVPYSHRLQGGSPGWMLHAEARRAARFRSLYRTVWGENPNMSRIVATAHVNGVPTATGEVDLLTYFTDRRAFGDGYGQMRTQMLYCVNHPGKGARPVPPGELALTVAFLRDNKPRQSIIARTSSFRLDVLHKYLSSQGPASYFEEGLQCSYSDDDARRFADDLLEEALGTYTPPDKPYLGYGEHIDAAFAVAENRVAADRAYFSCLRQIALYWGTLFAVGGHTSGESFVARNIGLKSAWREGQWTPQCIFMDHDSLFCPEPNDPDFYVEAFLNSAFLDQRYVFGEIREKDSVLGSVECLNGIYRVDAMTAQRGESEFCSTMAKAYQEVRQQLHPGGRLRDSFHEKLIGAFSHFDEVVRIALEDKNTPGAGRWRERARKWMVEMGYQPQLSHKFLQLIARHHAFLKANAYLYR